ncbi:MAG: ComF family protein [Parcubacteria group bacterium]|nr:ComF family protein [Parcubacteria group bacterium]
MFEKIRNFVLDTIFPVFCLSCKKEGVWLCQECEMLVPLANSQSCPSCNGQTMGGEVCERCAQKSHLKKLLSFGFYHNPVLRGLITNLKYNNAEELSAQAERFILRFLNKKSFRLDNNALIISVPLHKKRLWHRGFNQADIVAKVVSSYFNLKIKNDIIKRKEKTDEQTKISNEDRLINVKKAFACVNHKEIQGRSIILVDDVYTTGATMQECARVLLEAGAKDVKGIVLARG